ncbi:uncharacterized protein [Drosophila pseudoobscura]|uniref:Uncharacterized protein n=1 Tax=Drosophila pseudoobscura pseudoobscura TaxID=46245 RepID=A0A6I8UJC7_DROPS|nr:uncharacterized protein LOC4817397 [Drosophila pseudoobscura]
MDGTELSKFLQSQSVNWLRGLSRVQIGACDMLFRALRDDTEQESTYRVSGCLYHLGLRPMVKASRIKTIMKISNGSEIAFLYFIWEAEYKPINTSADSECTRKNFTVNEQLLLSAIAHLDMPATLRELDRLLPPSTHSKKLRPGGCAKIRHKTATQPKPTRRDCESPYFAPLRRPKLFNPAKNQQWGPPDSKLRFPEYDKNRGLLEIPEEDLRWFSYYKLSPAKRVIKKLLTDELNRLTLDPPIMGVEEEESLCHTHRLVKEAATKKKEEVAEEAFQRCMSLLDLSGSDKKASRKRVIQNLEREIECAAEKIRHFSQRQLIEVGKVRSGKVDGTCQVCTHLVSTPHTKRAGRADLSILLGADLHPKAHPLPQDDGLVKVVELQGGQQSNRRCGAGDCKLVEADCKLVIGDEILVEPSETDKKPPKRHTRKTASLLSHSHKRKSRKSSSTRHTKKKSQITKEDSKVLSTDFKNLADLIPPCSRTLQCPRKDPLEQETDCFTTRTGQGIELDYFKVFNLKGLDLQDVEPQSDFFPVDLEDKQPLIEKLCIAALAGSNGASPGPEKDNEWPSKAVLKAAASCATGVFRENAAVAEAAMAAKKKEEDESRTMQSVKPINPDDRQQIQALLKAALKIMKSNPNYVLATFPNAHKVPMLIDWVSKRYGKSYTSKEMQQLVNSSCQLIQTIGLRETSRQKRMLNAKIHTDTGLVSYSHKNRVMCQAKNMKKEYYGTLNQLALEETRLTWLALRGDSHLGGYIQDTFFAYMPANESDLKRHNLWQSGDYRDMVCSRERRRLA